MFSETDAMNGATSISSKLLIINALQGAGGYRLGRIFSCHANVYWYSHPDNGKTPWSFGTTDHVREAAFSKYHYDRIIADETYLPLIGSRIAKYWDNDKWINNWYHLMSQFVLPNKYLTYIVHDSPQYLRTLFPDSFIVNLISDPAHATMRHLATSARFRIDYVMERQLPDYHSAWVKDRDNLLSVCPDATEADLWAYRHNKIIDQYPAAVLAMNQTAHAVNIEQQAYADLNLDWDTLDPYQHEKYFGKIDNYHKILMQTDNAASLQQFAENQQRVNK